MGDVNDDNSDAISQMVLGERQGKEAGAGGDDDMSSSLMLTEQRGTFIVRGCDIAP